MTKTLPTPSVITYETTLHSTGKKVKFRPFLMREEKILMIAYEDNGPDREASIINALRQVLQDCILTSGIDISLLPSFDIEWLFLKIREKSVGSVVELNIKHAVDPAAPRDCEPCAELTAIMANLSDAKIVTPEGHKKLFDFGNGYFVSMRYPTMEALNRARDFEDSPKMVEIMMEIIATCIDKIMVGDDVFEASEFGTEYLVNWLMNFSRKNIDAINDEFFAKMPMVQLDINWKCKHCHKEETTKIRGLLDFFL